MQSQLIDIKSYFKRIHFEQNLNITPSFELLKTLIEHHIKYIPFENINPLLETGVELDIDAIGKKLIYSDRGGYCFEHNKLFLYILQELGFKAYSLAARVTVNRDSDDVNVAKSHRFNCVEIDQQLYLADVGFGLYTPPTPLEITPEKTTQHPYGSYKFSLNSDEYRLQNYIEHEWQELYRFTLEAAQEADFDVANWFLTTNQDSIFMNRLIASKITSDGRYSLSNDKLNFYPHDASQDKKTDSLSSAQAMMKCLSDTFGIYITNADHLEKKLTQTFFPESANRVTTRAAALRTG